MDAATCRTVRDAASRLGVRPARVYELIRLGWLPAVHIGRQVRITDAALAALARQSVTPKSTKSRRRPVTSRQLNELIVGPADLGAVLNLTHRHVERLAHDGWLPKEGRGRYPFGPAVHAYVMYLLLGKCGLRKADEPA